MINMRNIKTNAPVLDKKRASMEGTLGQKSDYLRVLHYERHVSWLLLNVINGNARNSVLLDVTLN